jgi:hypothetical protein
MLSPELSLTELLDVHPTIETNKINDTRKVWTVFIICFLLRLVAGFYSSQCLIINEYSNYAPMQNKAVMAITSNFPMDAQKAIPADLHGLKQFIHHKKTVGNSKSGSNYVKQ